MGGETRRGSTARRRKASGRPGLRTTWNM